MASKAGPAGRTSGLCDGLGRPVDRTVSGTEAGSCGISPMESPEELEQRGLHQARAGRLGQLEDGLRAGEIERDLREIGVLDLREAAGELQGEVALALGRAREARAARAQDAETDEQVVVDAVQGREAVPEARVQLGGVEALLVRKVLDHALEEIEGVIRVAEGHELGARAQDAGRVEVQHLAEGRVRELEVGLGEGQRGEALAVERDRAAARDRDGVVDAVPAIEVEVQTSALIVPTLDGREMTRTWDL